MDSKSNLKTFYRQGITRLLDLIDDEKVLQTIYRIVRAAWLKNSEWTS